MRQTAARRNSHAIGTYLAPPAVAVARRFAHGAGKIVRRPDGLDRDLIQLQKLLRQIIVQIIARKVVVEQQNAAVPARKIRSGFIERVGVRRGKRTARNNGVGQRGAAVAREQGAVCGAAADKHGKLRGRNVLRQQNAARGISF